MSRSEQLKQAKALSDEIRALSSHLQLLQNHVNSLAKRSRTLNSLMKPQDEPAFGDVYIDGSYTHFTFTYNYDGDTLLTNFIFRVDLPRDYAIQILSNVDSVTSTGEINGHPVINVGGGSQVAIVATFSSNSGQPSQVTRLDMSNFHSEFYAFAFSFPKGAKIDNSKLLSDQNLTLLKPWSISSKEPNNLHFNFVEGPNDNANTVAEVDFQR